jgi:hypothetical protein
VVSYQLKEIDEAAYMALPAGEDLFVHSYGGRRYLYPAPARFVNHSEFSSRPLPATGKSSTTMPSKHSQAGAWWTTAARNGILINSRSSA